MTPKKRRTRLAWMAMLMAGTAFLGLAPVAQAADLAVAHMDGTTIFWDVQAAHSAVTVHVATPEGTFSRTFEAGETPFFDASGLEGEIDGQYTWELSIVPQLSPAVRQQLHEAREGGNGEAVARKLRAQGVLPQGDASQSGYFRIAGGLIARDIEEESKGPLQQDDAPMEARRPGSGLESAGDGSLESLSAADQVIQDDLIVDGSACIGQDCVNGESFGFDTIRLKENNLRIKFQDTSNSGSFPTVDWQLTANDSANGGANKFSIDDIDNGRTPFTIEASAPSNSLYVDDGGRVGFGTATPVVELHSVNGDTPTLRLEQNGSSGFTPQTWDLAGNETNFFVRDVTNGSRLPFKIRPGADTNSLVIDNNGNVRMGGGISADTSMHLQRSDGTAKILVQETNSSIATRQLLELENNGNPQLRMEDTQSGGQAWAFTVGLSAFSISNFGVSGTQFQVDNDGTIRAQGSIVSGGTTLDVPDYVFEPDYNLMSIDELAEFVRVNKHLPNVPNEKAIREGGLNHSEFQMRLLEKVEELTLYTVDQHETLKELRVENSELKAKVAETDELKARVSQLEAVLQQMEITDN